MLTEEKIKRIKRLAASEKIAKIRSLWKTWDDLWEIKIKLPWLKLDEPIKNGYKKFFVLRSDISHRSDVHVFEDILAIINSTVYSRDANFKGSVKKNRRHKNKHKMWFKKEADTLESIPHFLHVIGKGEWEKLNIPEHYKKWFYYSSSMETDRWGYTSIREGWHFKYPYYFDTKVEDHFLTHYRQIDLDLESKISEVRHRIDANNLWPKIDHILRGTTGRRRDDWCQPKHIQEELKKMNSQHALRQEANEAMLELYFKSKFEEEYEPFDNPNYKFE